MRWTWPFNGRAGNGQHKNGNGSDTTVHDPIWLADAIRLFTAAVLLGLAGRQHRSLLLVRLDLLTLPTFLLSQRGRKDNQA